MAGTEKKRRAHLVSLYSDFRTKLIALRYRADGRGFKAHVTLVRDARPAKDFVFSPVTWYGETMVLVASERLSEGARYTVLM